MLIGVVPDDALWTPNASFDLVQQLDVEVDRAASLLRAGRPSLRLMGSFFGRRPV